MVAFADDKTKIETELSRFHETRFVLKQQVRFTFISEKRHSFAHCDCDTVQCMK